MTKSMRRQIDIHIPVELVEKILLNLCVKSLIRFSTVSKSWNSMIFGDEFVKRYRGREMIVLRPYYESGSDERDLVCPLSSMSSENPIDNAIAFVRPLKADSNLYFHASCNEFWCVEFERSLYFYNPSNQSNRKLPDPLLPPRIGTSFVCKFVYGLGYDSASNDYKMLKIHKKTFETELYSLTSDSWREVVFSSDPPNPNPIPSRIPGVELQLSFLSTIGLSVCGALYWLVQGNDNRVLSFDLSTEKFRELALPAVPERVFNSNVNCVTRHLYMTVLRGKLCVCMNYRRPSIRFVAWVMEEEEDKSWVKELEISYAHIHPISYSYLKPLYFYDGGGNLIKAVTSPLEIRKMFLYRDESTLEEKNFASNGCGILDTFTYVETLVSPWQYPSSICNSMNS